MDYVIAGNVMIDTVRFPDGRHSDGDHIGGPATFAYSGVKLWTDSVMPVSYTHLDVYKRQIFRGLFVRFHRTGRL